MALNPDAPIFISRLNTGSSTALLLTSDENPNPRVSYYLYPFHLQVYQTPYRTSLYYASPPPPSAYPYYTFPCSEFHVYSQPPLPNFFYSHPRCSIQELDGNSDTPNILAEDETVLKDLSACGLMLNRKMHVPNVNRSVVRAPRYQKKKSYRFTAKVERISLQISRIFDFEKEFRTSVMIKNIPTKFSKAKLIALLNKHCVEVNQKLPSSHGHGADPSEFDFFYLPIDFRTEGNFGYAFVNFTSPVGAWRLYKFLHNHSWSSAGSMKVCEVNYARIQGLSELMANADRMTFDSGIPDMFMPVHFEPPCNGVVRSVEHIHGCRINYGI